MQLPLCCLQVAHKSMHNYTEYTYVSLCYQKCGIVDKKTGICVFLLARHLLQLIWQKIMLDKVWKMWYWWGRNIIEV